MSTKPAPKPVSATTLHSRELLVLLTAEHEAFKTLAHVRNNTRDDPHQDAMAHMHAAGLKWVNTMEALQRHCYPEKQA